MDFPKSVPGVGLVADRFVDENPVAGTPGSLIPAAWGNAVTQEILAVLQLADVVPAENDNDQLALAINTLISDALRNVATPAQFDNDKSAVNSEFVQRALGNKAGYVAKNSATTLTAADAGKEISLIAGATVTTLPLLSSVVEGAEFSFICTGQPGAVVQRNGTDNISAAGPSLTSFTLNLGDTLTLVSAGTLWLAVSGTARDKFQPGLVSLLSSNGIKKIPDAGSPSGFFVIQWGAYLIPANATGASTDGSGWDFALPLTFPNGALQAFASFANPCTGTTGANLSLSKIYLKNSHTAAQSARWLAVGY